SLERPVANLSWRSGKPFGQSTLGGVVGAPVPQAVGEDGHVCVDAEGLGLDAMRPPIPARVQRLSRRTRAGGHSSATMGTRHVVVAVPQVSGLGTVHGRDAAPCPSPRRQYGPSPALSRKG